MGKPDFTAEISDLIRDDRIKHSTALFIQSLPAEEQVACLSLFRELKFGLNKQREIVEWFRDLRGRDRAKVAEVLARTDFQAIVSDILLTGPQKADLLRERLFELRFPTVSRYLKELDKKIRTLELPDGMRIVPVTPLEDSEFRLEVSFKSVRELLERLDGLRNTGTAKKLRALEEFLEKGPDPLFQ